MSRHEMYPMWEKLNYLVGLTYGSYADTNTDGAYAQVNPGMSAPLTMMTIGDYLVDQPGYIKDLSITVADDYPWDVIIDDEGKNAVGELPQALDINVGYQIIPQQIPDSYGKHFGKVGTQDVRGEDGLPCYQIFIRMMVFLQLRDMKVLVVVIHQNLLKVLLNKENQKIQQIQNPLLMEKVQHKILQLKLIYQRIKQGN